ncbi:MAG: hypothetical protein C4539_11680 [Ignavibacteriales bacterium]|nr:MAG: hypothetical protein C4539_11680 [Ignavibacteriales bacterium]
MGYISGGKVEPKLKKQPIPPKESFGQPSLLAACLAKQAGKPKGRALNIFEKTSFLIINFQHLFHKKSNQK